MRPRRCASTMRAPGGSTCRVARIFNTYGPRMRPDDGRIVSNLIVQALRGEAAHDLRPGAADPLLLLRLRPRRGTDRADGRRPPPRTAGQHRQSREFTILELAKRCRRWCPAARAWSSGLCRSTIPAPPPGHLPRARTAGLGPAVTLAEGLPQTIAWFAAGAAARRPRRAPSGGAGGGIVMTGATAHGRTGAADRRAGPVVSQPAHRRRRDRARSFPGGLSGLQVGGVPARRAGGSHGRSVLDIGCNAGFYALEMAPARRGRVVGIDSDPHYLRQARFAAERPARPAAGSSSGRCRSTKSQHWANASIS